MERALTGTPSRATRCVALRVVASGEDHDLLVPDDVPVVELLTELRCRLVPLGPTGSPPDVQLVRAHGDTLVLGLGLREQGVVDGTVLALVPDDDLRPRDAVDDAVAAVGAARAGSCGRVPATSGLVPGRTLLLGSLSVLAAGMLAGAPGAGASVVALPALALAAAMGLGGVVTARRRADVPSGLTALAGAALVAGVVVLREPGQTGSVLARLGTLLGLLAVALLLALPRRADVALGPTVAGLLTLGAGTALAAVPVTSTQVAVAVVAVATLGARVVPWVAVAAVGLDRATRVTPAGRHRPGTTGGVDLDEVDRAVAGARSAVHATTWGLGAVAVVAAVVVARSGDGGLLLVGCLGLLLASSDAVTGADPRSPGSVTGGAVLGAGLLSAGAGRADVSIVGVAVLLGSALVVLGRCVRGRPCGPSRAATALRTAVERCALLAVPPLVACGLGLLPTPWSLP